MVGRKKIWVRKNLCQKTFSKAKNIFESEGGGGGGGSMLGRKKIFLVEIFSRVKKLVF